ncbi:NAD-dependent epimerase/dehydratase family protein [Sulfuricystis multivorans]|uniref:NAD-dependent epimerase/dehydratase family protein n=1 Tax=Sulfuricystis multivorans TaxID=2211108 RepID=UPI000F83F1FB|nr:NAD-dependent epimerase/dehydratase family protein [Sulfuricystis multivorans]
MRKRRLLIVGCGDVVRRALPCLTRRWQVTALVRSFDPALRAQGVRQIRGDLDAPATLRRLAGIADAVLHSAPPPGEGNDDPRTRHLLATLTSARSLPRRLVYISTSGVYGPCGGERVAETRRLAAATGRARRRVAAETRLRAAGRRGMTVSILRAPGIYAADRLPLERVRHGDPVLLFAEDSYTNHIHAEDLAAACCAALERGRPNRSYNISDDSDIRMGDWFDKLADAFQLPRPPRVTRAEAQTRLSPQLLSFMNESRRLDNTRMKRELRLKLRYPTVDAGIEAALRNPPCSG